MLITSSVVRYDITLMYAALKIVTSVSIFTTVLPHNASTMHSRDRCYLGKSFEKNV